MSYLGEDGWGRVAAKVAVEPRRNPVRCGGGIAPAFWADVVTVRAG